MSSTIDHEKGIVTISEPCYSWAAPGHRLAAVGSGAAYGISYSDWVLRLLAPPPPPSVRRRDEVDLGPADEALLELLRKGSVHPSLD